MSVILNRAQAQQLLAFFGKEDAVVAVVDCKDGHSGPGLYTWVVEVGDEGAVFLDPNGVTACEGGQDGTR